MTTAAAPALARATHIPPSPYRLSFPRLVRSEWLKLATLRSTWWSIGLVAVLTIGIATLIASTIDDDFPAILTVVSGVQFTMLLAGILGVIAVTGEYSTGMIRSTLAAEPRRGVVLAAKALVVAAFMFVASLAIFLVAAAVVTPILQRIDVAFPWGDVEGAWQPLLAASLSMSVFALIGLGFGFVIRGGAGAIAATIGLLFVLPLVFSVFSSMSGWAWLGDLGHYLPMSASQNVITPQDEWGLSAPVALATLGAWVVATIGAAWMALRTRDA
ncbi:MAG: ABC transporter permease [Microbacterium sp.]|uniref:ABC transporter permease n=1 Tax=Microbacterium sp. TaxID=51671 RepID=UPI0039E4EDD6